MPTKLALNKLHVFEALGYEPHPSQRTIHCDNARMKVVSAGRRAGKSHLGGHELVPEAILTYTMAEDLRAARQRREFWIVGPEYTDSEKEFRVAYNALERAEIPFDHPGTYNAPWNGEMEISAFGGTFQVKAKSAKYPGTLVGEGLAGVILSEAAKLKPIVWHKFIRPTLADHRGWALMVSTPEGRNWFYEMWKRGQDPNDPTWASWRLPAWVNPTVYPLGATEEGIKFIRSIMEDEDRILTPSAIAESGVDPEIVDMMRDMTEERFNQEIAALFTEFVGRVFKDFDESTHVTDLEADPSRPIYLAVDYGWTNPFVALAIQVNVWDDVHVLADYRVQQRDIEDIAKDLLTARSGIFAKAKTVYPDPAGPGDTAILAKYLHVKDAGGTGGELNWRLQLIRQAMRLMPLHAPWEDRRPKLLFDRSVSNETIREFSEYRYPDTKEEQNREAPEHPLKKDDHAPEALGRFFVGFFGGPNDTDSGGRARVTKASVNAR